MWRNQANCHLMIPVRIAITLRKDKSSRRRNLQLVTQQTCAIYSSRRELQSYTSQASSISSLYHIKILQFRSMELPPSILAVGINFIMFLFTFCYPQPAVSRPHNNFTDLESLLAFKTSVQDPYGILATNWTTNASFCSWTGVYCSSRRQRVVGLDLDNFSLQGTFSPHLANLSYLSSLHLRNNTLVGPIPKEISQLFRLEALYLSYNSLSGPIPSSFFNMSSLVNASFYSNNLSGSLPANDELYMLPKLKIINLASNQLSCKIPAGFARSSQLQLLSLNDNEFSGTIPSLLGNLTRLTVLGLGDNHFTGTIPTFIGNLTKLTALYMFQNYLQGVIPEELGNLVDLQYMYLQQNDLTGSIPLALLNASMLEILQITDNKLTGPVPAAFGQSFPHITCLHMGYNLLTGGLEFVTSLSNCRLLARLEMGSNEFEGVLPHSVGNFSANLEYFLFNRNNIKGRIPTELGNLSGLLDLELDYNELTGTLPLSLVSLKNLQELQLGSNRISGSIPSEFGLMTSLVKLSIKGNTLSGPIPDSLGNLSRLQHLDLSANRFSNIPNSLWSLTGLVELNISDNTLDGPLSAQASNLKSLYSLAISNSQLSGDIPSTIGELQMLAYLDLSKNFFHGQIPDSVKGLFNIEYMNLSHNFLSGAIPKSLANLRYLNSLDLCFNKLQGQIPDGRVFSNLSIPSLEGNAALCGDRLLGFSPCPTNIFTSHSKSKLHLLIYILPPVASLVLLLCCFYLRLTYHRRDLQSNLPSTDTSLDIFRVISYNELVRATENFRDDNLLGSGSFSSVFKAYLDDGLITAVKVLNLENQAASSSFEAESYALSKLRHRNIVKIISVCSNMDFKAFVLEFMSNGSLEKWLHSHDCYLNLLQRINIMVDVSIAFEYLHHHHPQIVVHCDLKPSNVLLDENMVAHVSDFGISKMMLGDSKSKLSSRAPGTIGYMAPEYGTTGKVSRKGDVYSFGILLLETFTRKRPSDAMFHGELSLRQWVSKAYPTAVLEIVDPNLLKEESCVQQQPDQLAIVHQCLSSLIELGLLCSSDSPAQRILMKDVVPILQKIKSEYPAKF